MNSQRHFMENTFHFVPGAHVYYRSTICFVSMHVQSLETQPLCYRLFNRVTNGELQIKITDAARQSQELSDVVGCVKGFLGAQK